MTGRSPDICGLEEIPEDQNQVDVSLFHTGPERGQNQVPPHPGWEEMDTRMEQASPGQHRGLGEVGLGALHLLPQCLASYNQTPLLIFYPKVASGIPGAQTCDFTRV